MSSFKDIKFVIKAQHTNNKPKCVACSLHTDISKYENNDDYQIIDIETVELWLTNNRHTSNDLWEYITSKECLNYMNASIVKHVPPVIYHNNTNIVLYDGVWNIFDCDLSDDYIYDNDYEIEDLFMNVTPEWETNTLWEALEWADSYEPYEEVY